MKVIFCPKEFRFCLKCCLLQLQYTVHVKYSIRQAPIPSLEQSKRFPLMTFIKSHSKCFCSNNNMFDFSAYLGWCYHVHALGCIRLNPAKEQRVLKFVKHCNRICLPIIMTNPLSHMHHNPGYIRFLFRLSVCVDRNVSLFGFKFKPLA